MRNATDIIISIVLPVYCEATTISGVLNDIYSATAGIDISVEFVLVDDGSSDGTWDEIGRQAAIFPNLCAVRLSRNFGKEAAIRAGLEIAKGHGVVVMDADGQHPPALLTEMINHWRAGNVEIVEAVKTHRGTETLFNRAGAGLFYILWNKLSGFELKGASDYKLLDRRAVDAFLEMDERNVFFRGMAAWIGFRRIQIPFDVAPRAGGRSGWSPFHLLRLALTALTGFSAVPLQIVTLAGVFFLLFAGVFAIQTLYVYMMGHAVTGFATVILLLLIIGSFLMISLGIIGEYLARIYEEVKRRPHYIVSESVGPIEAKSSATAFNSTDREDKPRFAAK